MRDGIRSEFLPRAPAALRSNYLVVRTYLFDPELGRLSGTIADTSRRDIVAHLFAAETIG